MKTILIPFDFSANARKALAYALELGKLFESQLYIYHVLHESPYTLAAAATEQEMEKLIAKDGEEKTAALKDEVNTLLQSLPITFSAERIKTKAEYNPLVVEKIIAVAKEQDAELVVMGTHGTSGIKKFFFGSNTSNMITKSDIPVLAIPEQYEYTPVKTILYASDLENLPAELKRIIPFAHSLHAGINVLHFDYGQNERKITEEEANIIIKNNQYQHIKFVKEKADLTIPLLKQIRHYMQEHQPEWLTMFTKEKSLWDKLIIGSKTEDMAHTLKVPLLSFKKPG